MFIPGYGSTISVAGYKHVPGTWFYDVALISLNPRDFDLKSFCSPFREESLIRLGNVVSHLTVSKDSIAWDLVELEHMVQTTKERQQDSDDEDEDIESERPTLII
jgi:hypothetical protein